jgi:mRNA interferase RelE/StbE
LHDYRIFETEQFQADLRGISRSGQAAVVAKLRAVVYPQLGAHPHFGPNIRKLKGYTPPTWRYRIGSWRFFYEIDEGRKLVSTTAASHRGSAY